MKRSLEYALAILVNMILLLNVLAFYYENVNLIHRKITYLRENIILITRIIGMYDSLFKTPLKVPNSSLSYVSVNSSGLVLRVIVIEGD